VFFDEQFVQIFSPMRRTCATHLILLEIIALLRPNSSVFIRTRDQVTIQLYLGASSSPTHVITIPESPRLPSGSAYWPPVQLQVSPIILQ
jgi:hypothetical protein